MKNLGRNEQHDNPEGSIKMPGSTPVKGHKKIPHQEILRASQSSAGQTGLVEIYRQRVLSQKTRSIRLLGRKSSAKIIHTLLGYEVKAVNKRLHCPDLATAQYLRIFTELGCHVIKLPYDPTLTAQLIPEFERSLESIPKAIRELFPRNPSIQRYAIQKTYAIVRRQLHAVQKSLQPIAQRDE
jgi:hypothetical protein